MKLFVLNQIILVFTINKLKPTVFNYLYFNVIFNVTQKMLLKKIKVKSKISIFINIKNTLKILV